MTGTSSTRTTAAPDHRYSPWQHASELGVRVVFGPAPDGLTGYGDAQTQTVLLDEQLTLAGRRCELARQLVRLEHRSDPCAMPQRAVVALVARRLIHADDLEIAMLAHDDEADQAGDLCVDVPTLRARQAEAFRAPPSCHS